MPPSRLPSLALVVALLALSLRPAAAQEAAPFLRTGDLFVADATNNAVFRLQDLSQDGDFNDAAELIPFYDSVNGSIALQNCSGVAVGPDGTVYASDSGADLVIALLDLNGDGDAVDAGEHWVFFNGGPGGNPAGIVMASAANLHVDAANVVWVAVANTGGGGVDLILRLQDLGGTPGANDLGEASVYATFGADGAVGDSIPTDVVGGPNGDLYYLETGSTGVFPKGIYRLHDDNPANGVIDGPQEVSAFWTASASGFYWGLAVDLAGAFYVADTGADVLWRLADLNGDLVIAPGGAEAVAVWTSPSSSNLWKVVPASDGSLFGAETQTPDRILHFVDLVPNGSFNDPGEVVEAWSDLFAPPDIGNPRSIAAARAPTLAAPANPSISAPFAVTLDARTGDAFALWASDIPLATPAPPFGVLEILIVPPAFAFEVVAGAVPPSGRFTLPVPALGNAALVGITLHLQALAGQAARLELSNRQTLTFSF